MSRSGNVDLPPVNVKKGAYDQYVAPVTVDLEETIGDTGIENNSRNVKSKPLPPITAEDANKLAARNKMDSPTSSMSSAASKSHQKVKQQEDLEDEEYEELDEPDKPILSAKLMSKSIVRQNASQSKVGFGEGEITAPESFNLKGYDGKDHAMESLATQTEWSWLEEGNRRTSFISGASGEQDDKASSHREGKASIKSGKSIRSRSTKSGIQSEKSKASALSLSSIPPYPKPKIDDEFGIPLLGSDTEAQLDLDLDVQEKEETVKRSRIDRITKAVEDGLLPSVGPPQILQYQRESEMEPFEPPELPEDHVLDAAAMQALSLRKIGSVCEFCGNPIPPLTSLDNQVTEAPEQQFCCAQYRELLEFALAQSKVEEEPTSGVFDLKSISPVDQKARKKAKEMTDKRVQNRQEPKQQVVTVVPTQGTHAVSRQMKTINYQLSNKRWLEAGWTLRPPSPLGPSEEFPVFEIDLEGITSLAEAMTISPRHPVPEVIEKFYPSGQKFLTLFTDGTGNVFYPSGNTAIVMSRGATPGLMTYVVTPDTPQECRDPVLAIFDTRGHGTFYYASGKIRLCYDAVSGIELDSFGNRRRQWSWEGEPHIHAPPFQPLCFALNRVIGARMTNRESIILNFVTNSQQCRLNVGSKLKLVNPEVLPTALFASKVETIELDEIRARVWSCLERADTASRYPHHPQPNKVPLSLPLRSMVQKVQSARTKMEAK